MIEEKDLEWVKNALIYLRDHMEDEEVACLIADDIIQHLDAMIQEDL